MAGLAIAAGRLDHDIALHPAEVAFLAGVFGSRALVGIHVGEIGMVMIKCSRYQERENVSVFARRKKKVGMHIQIEMGSQRGGLQ